MNGRPHESRDTGDRPDVGATPRQDDDALARSLELSRQRQRPPGQIPGYAIVQQIGEGAFGSVWLAQERNTGKQVAIKFYTHRRGLDWSLLNREVEKLAVLYTSRNIIGLLDVGWDSDPAYYVMEYLERGSLATFLSGGPLPVDEAVLMATRVLRGLAHAHGRGILHCDLKPANVLLDDDFQPRLCDFGQSRLSQEQNPSLGTLFYMAPEQANLRSVPDARWDVYALGALLYCMVCGHPPHWTADREEEIRSANTLDGRLQIYRRILESSPKADEHRQVSGMDRSLAEIIDRCLASKPDNRFPNPHTVLEALNDRERRKVRRPLIALGILVPSVLLLAMWPLAWRAMSNAVQKSRQNLTHRSLESHAVSVQILARSIDHELHDRQTELASVAANGDVLNAWQHAVASRWSDRAELISLLDALREESGQRIDALGRVADVSWFVVDAAGVQRWRSPTDARTLDRSWAHRDYFHGRGLEYSVEDVPTDIAPLQAPYVSLAFRSRATQQPMVAISVPIWNKDRTQVIGVLARTAHLGQLLAEYKPNLRTGTSNVNRLLALVDHRDGRILDHPWFQAESSRQLAPEQPLQLSDKQLEWVRRLSKDDADNPMSGQLETYEDPVGQLDLPERQFAVYSEPWLAAFWPVGDTGWTAIVQERKSAALRPIDEIRSDLISYGILGLVASGGLIAAVWYAVLRALVDSPSRHVHSASGNGDNRDFDSSSHGHGAATTAVPPESVVSPTALHDRTG